MFKPIHFEPAARVHCDNCGHETTANLCNAIRDPGDRLHAGEPIPAGECRECGACAYLIEPVQFMPDSEALTIDTPDRYATATLLVAALRIAQNHCDLLDAQVTPLGYDEVMSEDIDYLIARIQDGTATPPKPEPDNPKKSLGYVAIYDIPDDDNPSECAEEYYGTFASPEAAEAALLYAFPYAENKRICQVIKNLEKGGTLQDQIPHTIDLHLEGGAIFDTRNIPPGIRIRVRDYDIEYTDPDALTLDESGNHFQEFILQND